jgi:hypothetical protein
MQNNSMTDFKTLYPIRDCDFEEKDNLVVVLFQNKKPSFIEKLFFKKQLEKPYKIDLDEIGSFIWHLCDGKKNIGEITNSAKERFLEKIEPAGQRVELFINQMTKNRIIKLYEKK